jgi:hypothetical protein
MLQCVNIMLQCSNSFKRLGRPAFGACAPGRPSAPGAASAATAAEEGREGRGRAIFVAETSENAFATVATSQNDDPAMDAFAGRRLETVQGEFITAAALSLKVQALWTIVNEGGSALKDVPLAVKNVLLSEAWREREWGGRIIKQAADGLSTRWKNLSKTTVRH